MTFIGGGEQEEPVTCHKNDPACVASCKASLPPRLKNKKSQRQTKRNKTLKLTVPGSGKFTGIQRAGSKLKGLLLEDHSSKRSITFFQLAHKLEGFREAAHSKMSYP